MSEKRDSIILIRCTKKTKEIWRQVLYDYKSKGWTAEDLLLYLIKRERNIGKVY